MEGDDFRHRGRESDYGDEPAYGREQHRFEGRHQQYSQTYGPGQYGQYYGPSPYGQGPYGQYYGPSPYGQSPYGQYYGPNNYSQGPYGQYYGPIGWGGRDEGFMSEPGRFEGARGIERERGRGGFRGKGPKGWTRSDERIREDVCERLADSDDVDASDITVKVEGGEVTLEGTVDSRWAKREAEELACGARGAKDCLNHLKVKAEPATASSAMGKPGNGHTQGSRTPAPSSRPT
jgi:hypothetical protein